MWRSNLYITQPRVESQAGVQLFGKALLNESYVIFITENDVLGKSLPIGDEEHIVYVNSQIRNKTSLGMLMHDFACTEAKDMYYHVLADRVRYFKEDEKGVTVMCKAMEDMRNETARENTLQIANNMLSMKKFTYEDIARATGLTVDEIKELDSKKSA